MSNGLAAFASAVGIYHNLKLFGWWLGVFLSIGAFVGFIVSRTIGMPGMEPEPWLEPINGPISLISEAIFVGLFLVMKPPVHDS